MEAIQIKGNLPKNENRIILVDLPQVDKYKPSLSLGAVC